MHGLTRASVTACMLAGCGVGAQSLSSAGYLPTTDQKLALLLAFIIAVVTQLLASGGLSKKRPKNSDILELTACPV